VFLSFSQIIGGVNWYSIDQPYSLYEKDNWRKIEPRLLAAGLWFGYLTGHSIQISLSFSGFYLGFV
jgi:hypothetical protein